MRLDQSNIRWKYHSTSKRKTTDPDVSHSYNIPKLKLGQYTPGALLRM